MPKTSSRHAINFLLKKVGINRLLEIKQQAQSGSIDQAALLSEIENKLSEEELSALKYVIYKELYK